MNRRDLSASPAAWWVAAVVAGTIFCVAATSIAVYDATSPTTLTFHVVLRKIYSIVAFAIVGYFVARARRAAGQSAQGVLIGGAIAVYSAFIEVLQYYLDPLPEGLFSNAVDVVCGYIGGALAAMAASRSR